MTKEPQLEIIYSRQTSDFVQGKTYANPRFFSTPRQNAKKVYVVGSWPKIEAAYRALGVPVERLDADAVVEAIEPNAPQLPEPPVTNEYAHVEIPEDWSSLPWVGENSIRSLAMRLTNIAVLNKAQASAIIRAELARRGDGAEIS